MAFFFIKSGHITIQKAAEFQNKKVPVTITVLEPLKYFGEEGPLADDDHPLAKATAIAGDINLISKADLEEHASKGAVSLSGGAVAFRAGQIKEGGCEVIFATVFDVRQTFRHLLQQSPLMSITNRQAQALYRKEVRIYKIKYLIDLTFKCPTQIFTKKWEIMKKKEMNRLIKERFRDPNADLDAKKAGVWKF